MGVCRYFQQGTCRFGAKCHNEHFDIKQYLKTDIESSINGKMWPFSVYGPFKDKANMPNFIEDQSFEEVRYQAYESKRQNCFEQFHQQFSKEVLETANKMKTMLQMPPQVTDLMISIYETPEGTQPASNTNNNPFAAQAQTTANSIFSKPTLGTNNTGNIFGNTTAPSFGPPATNSNSIFGGGSVTPSSTSTNNIFGGGAANTNLFSQQQQQTQPSFGQQQQPAQQSFGQQQTQQSFGQQQQQAQLSFGQQQQQQNSQFGQQQSMPAQAHPSIFAQAQTQQQLNPFGHKPAAAAGASPFSGGNLFAQPVANPAPFASQQQSTSVGLFAQAAPAAAPSAGNMFSQAAQAQQQTTSNAFFSQAAPAIGFQQNQQSGQQMQAEMQQQHRQDMQTYNNPPIYSLLEDLTAEEIAAYKADQFAPGQVPFKPPPRELC